MNLASLLPTTCVTSNSISVVQMNESTVFYKEISMKYNIGKIIWIKVLNIEFIL